MIRVKAQKLAWPLAITVATAVALTGCVSLDAPTACQSEGRCSGDAAPDVFSEAGDGSTDSAVDDTIDVGSEVDASDADGGACGTKDACVPGSSRVGGACSIDETGTETCGTDCRWKTECKLNRGWRTIAVAPPSFKARVGFSATWHGAGVLIWGGEAGGTYLNDGANYDYASDTWKDVASSGLGGRVQAGAALAGTALVIWGGKSDAADSLADGARYDVGTNTWKSVAAAGISARYGHVQVGVPSTSTLVIWGGYGGAGKCPEITCADGAVYDAASNTWSTLPSAPLSSRTDAFGVWTGSDVLVWGGHRGDTYYADGARYSPATKSWTKMADAPSVLAGRLEAAVAFGDGSLFVWGGGTFGGGSVATGARYDVATNSWKELSIPVTTVMKPRSLPMAWASSDGFAVWSGAESGTSVVLGGANYSKSSDAWLALPTKNQPSARILAAVVPTGRSFFVWGGKASSSGAFSPDGAVYVP